MTHGPVSFAILWTGRARAARQRPVAARAANVRFPAMGSLTRLQPGVSDALGADLAVGRSDPLRLPPQAAALRRRYRRRPLLPVHHLPRTGRRHDRWDYAR